MVTIRAGQFKAQCLKIMDQVKNKREEILITKHGKPVAKLVPVDSRNGDEQPAYGFMQDAVKITGNIVVSSGEHWTEE